MVLYEGLRCSKILKKEVPHRRWLVKNQRSATWWGWNGVIKNVRLKSSQQNTRLGMTQVRGFTALLKDMSDILWFNKTKVTVLRALFRAFLGYPGLPLGRPDPAQIPWHPARPNQPEPNCEAWWQNVRYVGWPKDTHCIIRGYHQVSSKEYSETGGRVDVSSVPSGPDRTLHYVVHGMEYKPQSPSVWIVYMGFHLLTWVLVP